MVEHDVEVAEVAGGLAGVAEGFVDGLGDLAVEGVGEEVDGFGESSGGDAEVVDEVGGVGVVGGVEEGREFGEALGGDSFVPSSTVS